MFFHPKNLFDLQKKSVFLINFFLIICVILLVYFELDFSYFFYGLLAFTFVLSYFFFKKSKHLAKMLILTNLFIFFYFLFPEVVSFFSTYVGTKSIYVIMIYNLLIAYLFLRFSGYQNEFFESIKQFRFPVFLVILLVGFTYGLFFFLIKEPIPSDLSVSTGISISYFALVLFNSIIIGLSEQMIFSGFLFNVYKNLTTKWDAFFQVSLIFTLFHMLRFEVVAQAYYEQFPHYFIGYLVLYYIFLFFFMVSALYLYSFSSKKYKGSFIYAVALHFITDFALFLFYILNSAIS